MTGRGVCGRDGSSSPAPSAWPALRAELVSVFGDWPSVFGERECARAYELSPVGMRHECSRIIAGVKAGTIGSGWGALVARCQAVTVPAASSSSPSADDSALLERRCRTWIRAEARHYPRDVVLGELEGRHVEPELQARMLTYWARLHHEQAGTPEPEQAAGFLAPDRQGEA